jgi:hypothetical protein
MPYFTSKPSLFRRADDREALSRVVRTWNWKADPIQRKVQSARVRHLAGLVLEQTAIFLAVVLPVWIAFYLRGEIVHKVFWIAFAVTLMAAAGGFQVKRRFRSSYEIAQILDSRAGQRDLFSTAWFLLEHPALAAGPNVSAQIARANMVLPQIQLSDLFPVPLRSALAVLGLSALLIAAVFVLPGQTARGKSLTAAPGLGSRLLSQDGPALPSSKTEDSERRQAEGAAAKNAPGLQMTDPRLATRGPANSGAPSPSLDAGARQTPGITEAKDKQDALASDEARRLSAGAAQGEDASAGQPGTQKKSDESGEPHKNSGVPQESSASKLLAPLQRLLKKDKQPLTTAKVDKQLQTATETPSAAKRDLGHSAGSAPGPTPGGQQVSENGSGASAQQPFDKAPATSAENRGGPSEFQASTGAPETIPTAINVIELVQTNPEGETGHTKVEAVRAATPRKQGDSSARAHLADSGYGSTRDDVPLGYQRSLQAYFERDKR